MYIYICKKILRVSRHTEISGINGASYPERSIKRKEGEIYYGAYQMSRVRIDDL